MKFLRGLLIFSSLFVSLGVEAVPYTDDLVSVEIVYNRNFARILRRADSTLSDSGYRLFPGAVLEMKVPRSWLNSTHPKDFDFKAIMAKLESQVPEGGERSTFYPVTVITNGKGGAGIPPKKIFSMSLDTLAASQNGEGLDKGSYIIREVKPAGSGTLDLPLAPSSIPIPRPRPPEGGGSVGGSSGGSSGGFGDLPSVPSGGGQGGGSVGGSTGSGGTGGGGTPVMESPTSPMPPHPRPRPSRPSDLGNTEDKKEIEKPELKPPTSEGGEEVVSHPPTEPTPAPPAQEGGGEQPAAVVPPEPEAPSGCQEVLTDKAPFAISDATGMGDKNYENFRAGSDARAVKSYIPRGSIVRLIDSDTQNIKSNTYYPVQVVSTPSDNLEDKLSKSRLKNHILNDKPKAQRGDKGYLHSGSLKAAKDYTFFVNSDAPLVDIPGMDGSLKGKPLQLVTEGGKYKVKRCCETQGEQEICRDQALFKILDGDLSETLGTVALSEENLCRAYSNDQVAPLLKIAEMAQNSLGQGMESLQFIDSTGMVQLPMNSATCTDAGVKGFMGTYHYLPDSCKTLDDAFAKADSACAFMQAIKAHNKKCTSQGCQVQWGDCYHKDGWNVHSSHDSGQCFDVRPLREDNAKNKFSGIAISDKDMDEDKTRNLIETFKQAGAKTILFGTSRNGANGWKQGGVKNYPMHHNHIHVCFPSGNSKVQSVCKNGL